MFDEPHFLPERKESHLLQSSLNSFHESYDCGNSVQQTPNSDFKFSNSELSKMSDDYFDNTYSYMSNTLPRRRKVASVNSMPEYLPKRMDSFYDSESYLNSMASTFKKKGSDSAGSSECGTLRSASSMSWMSEINPSRLGAGRKDSPGYRTGIGFLNHY